MELSHLEVPVAEFSPEEPVNTARRLVQEILIERLVDFPDRSVQPRQDPAVREREVHGPELLFGRQRVRFFDMVSALKRAAFPYLGGKRSITLELILGQHKIRPGSAEAGEREPHRVGPVLVANQQRVADVTF